MADSADESAYSRVMANRIWQWHFGQGIVATPNDFGTRGASPTIPELLDHLASVFVKSGWSLKAMHRLIVMSSTYQQATASSDGGQGPEAFPRTSTDGGGTSRTRC